MDGSQISNSRHMQQAFKIARISLREGQSAGTNQAAKVCEFAMTGHRIQIKGYVLDKNGKPVKRGPTNVSAKIRQKKSKRVRVARRGQQ